MNGCLNACARIDNAHISSLLNPVLMRVDEARDQNSSQEINEDCVCASILRHFLVRADGEDSTSTNGNAFCQGVGVIHRYDVTTGKDSVSIASP